MDIDKRVEVVRFGHTCCPTSCPTCCPLLVLSHISLYLTIYHSICCLTIYLTKYLTTTCLLDSLSNTYISIPHSPVYFYTPRLSWLKVIFSNVPSPTGSSAFVPSASSEPTFFRRSPGINHNRVHFLRVTQQARNWGQLRVPKPLQDTAIKCIEV